MIEFKRILVVSRLIQSCRKAVQYGVSLAKKFDAKLYVVHPIYNPFGIKGWGMGTLSMKTEYDKLLLDTRQKLTELVQSERTKGLAITEMVPEGEPTQEILKAIEKHDIDLLIMLAHEEGRLEHILFGHSNDELIRKMPCTIVLVKKEAEAAL